MLWKDREDQVTHDELLAEIDERATYLGNEDSVYKALHAVVELHKPVIVLTDVPVCSHCESDELTDPYGAVRSYPCPTIQAIEKELA